MTTARSLLKIIAAEQLTPKNAESVVKREVSKYFKIVDITVEGDDWDDENNATMYVTVSAGFRKPCEVRAFDGDFSIDITIDLSFTFYNNGPEPTLDVSFDIDHSADNEQLLSLIDQTFNPNSEWDDCPELEGELGSMVKEAHGFAVDQWKQFSIRFHKQVDIEVKSVLEELTKVGTHIHNFHV